MCVIKGEMTFSIRTFCSCSLHPRCCLMWYWWAHFIGRTTNQAAPHSQENSIWSDCLGSARALFVRWDFLTSELGEKYHKRSMHSFHKRYGSSVLPQGDASSQECADFRCGEWQPWWLSNRYSVVIETMFRSAGETRPISRSGGPANHSKRYSE